MNLLTLANCPLDETQGSGYVIVGYARRLRERGHRVDLVGPPEIELPPSSPITGGNRAIRYRQMLGMAVAAFGRRNHGYDVIELYGGEAWLAVSLLRRLSRRPLLVAHSNGLEPQAERLLRQGQPASRWYQRDLSRLYARAFRGADGLVTVSRFDRDFALAEGYLPAERVVAIENPLPAAYLDQPLDPPGPERPPAIVVCGSWIERKGIALLAQDGAAFLAAFPDWRLVLVGVGAGFVAAEHFPPAVVSRIEVIPSADRESGLRAVYRRCRVAVQASVYESFGLAAAEAMACGCALVSTRVGFAASLANEAEALLLPAGESPHLFTALRRLAEDDALRRRLAAAGHARVQGLRWEPAVELLESTYHSWLDERSRRAP